MSPKEEYDAKIRAVYAEDDVEQVRTIMKTLIGLALIALLLFPRI